MCTFKNLEKTSGNPVNRNVSSNLVFKKAINLSLKSMLETIKMLNYALSNIIK